MEEISLGTPGLLFSAGTLILLAYTNRFLSYAQVVRSLKERSLHHTDELLDEQIRNLKRRLELVRYMQVLGIGSLLLCVVAMGLVFVDWGWLAAYAFGGALVLLMVSLVVCIWEIQISVKALDIYLRGMEKRGRK